MEQVLARAGLPIEQAQQLGGVLSLTLKWECRDLLDTDGCLPRLQVSQLAPGVPYYQQWATYFRRGAQPDVLYRDLYQSRGLRLLVSTVGEGEKLDLAQCMLQVFVALALMPIASSLADTIMQNLFSE